MTPLGSAGGCHVMSSCDEDTATTFTLVGALGADNKQLSLNIAF